MFGFFFFNFEEKDKRRESSSIRSTEPFRSRRFLGPGVEWKLLGTVRRKSSFSRLHHPFHQVPRLISKLQKYRFHYEQSRH